MSNDPLARRIMIGNAQISMVPTVRNQVMRYDTPEPDHVRLALLTTRLGEVAEAHSEGSGMLEDALLKLGAACMEWGEDLLAAQAL